MARYPRREPDCESSDCEQSSLKTKFAQCIRYSVRVSSRNFIFWGKLMDHVAVRPQRGEAGRLHILGVKLGQFWGEVELFGGEASPAPPSLDETLSVLVLIEAISTVCAADSTRNTCTVPITRLRSLPGRLFKPILCNFRFKVLIDSTDEPKTSKSACQLQSTTSLNHPSHPSLVLEMNMRQAPCDNLAHARYNRIGMEAAWN